MNCWCLSACVQVRFPLPHASYGVYVDGWMQGWLQSSGRESISPMSQKGEHGLGDRWELDPWPLGRGSSRQKRLLGHQEGLQEV